MKRRDAISFTPLGLHRFEAAAYIGVSATLFDEMVNDGRMPRPKAINSRKVWSRAELDAYFASLPAEGENGHDPTGVLDALLRVA